MAILANMERLPVNAVIISTIEIQLYTEVPGLSGYSRKFFQLRLPWMKIQLNLEVAGQYC